MAGTDEMLCFSLYAASRATTQAYRRALEPWDLTYPQYLVLVSLWTRGARSVGEIGDELMLDSGTLSPLLRRLEQRGLITRTRRVEDERVVDVDLTERGRALRAEMRDVPGLIASCMRVDLRTARTLLDSLHALTRQLQVIPEAHAS
jgi:MarR family transcriptional regulator, organic hydroperoxide resistance regulator